MPIKKLVLDNFTVFDKLDIEFSEGINIFVGENGTGKTHTMKVLYSACRASRKDTSFSEKLAKVFRPDDFSLHRLVKRKGEGNTAIIQIHSDLAGLKIVFSTRTKKWNAEVFGEEKWEKNNAELISNYIPAKEILSNAFNFNEAYGSGNIDFDETYSDIITSARVDITSGKTSASRKKYLDILKRASNGTVTIENEKFYLKPGNQAKLEFHLVAEGLRKLALLWQLIKNGTLEKGSVLFWDEPEANLNPTVIPSLVEILLELQKEGVQIFISTHDYILARYFEVMCKEDNHIMFYSFYKNAANEVVYEKAEKYSKINNNPIEKAYKELYDRIIDKALED